MLEKAYNAKQYEDAIYAKWEQSGAFKANHLSKKDPFTLSMPPPNATGTLHLGHAIMLAIEDTVARHRRMKGYEVLYLPGTDHAAIATESVVIKLVQEKEGIRDARSLGREKLIERIAQFVEKSQGTIRSQIRKMGTSCDWSREGYTMDPSLNRCVNEVFKKMFDDGLIYRAERVVNWDTALQTTLADDEVTHEEQEGILYTIEYLTAEQTGGEPIYVSTSRPETKLGDNALAVHPDDKRYQHLIGKDFNVQWPSGQTINVTVIADHEVDAEFGSGVLGVTPFHSKIDYDLWVRHRDKIKAQPFQVIDEQGKMTPQVQGYEGLSVKQAREKLVEELRKEGRLKEEKKYTQQMAISYRSKKPVEALPKLQWFIDVNKKVVPWPTSAEARAGKKEQKMSLKEVMLNVVESGDIEIIPERFSKTYFHWIENLRDWCISRQIWWGHQIPVWYKDDKVHADIKPPEGEGWIQDEDTLDTWFSSGLWTWSTLVDPKLTDDLSLSLSDILEKSPDYQKFHPTQFMETGYDILFFWVARMILMTTYTLRTAGYSEAESLPFRTVYLHGLIRTREGKKMSKSDPKTCIDPLDMIELYGADALRMSMVIGNSPGNDMRLYEEKIKGYRNFTNKLWNASRFVLGILEEKGLTEVPELDPNRLSKADQWILTKLSTVIFQANKNLDEYKISETGQLLYDFLWNDFCDWYLELSKGEKQNLAVLYHVLKNILILLHPITPFVTEQIWSELPGVEGMLITQPYPEFDHREAYYDDTMDVIISIIQSIRRMRGENKIEAAAKIPVTIYAHDLINLVEQNQEEIIRLARISELTLEKTGNQLEDAATDAWAGIEIYIPLNGLVDNEKEQARLVKEITALESYVKGLESKLNNAQFAQNAPSAIVQAERDKLAEAQEKLEKLKAQRV